MTESVVVGVRVRPFSPREEELKAELCIEMNGPSTSITDPTALKREPITFTFDQSFWSHDGFEDDGTGYKRPTTDSRYADQQLVFDVFGQQVLDNAWQGFHCTLFAYGQTGSGKSYSIFGDEKKLNKGIVPISCERIFKRIGENENPLLSYQVSVSMIEIYNEAVQDLTIQQQDRPNKGLQIRESKALGVYIEGVTTHAVASYAAIEKVISQGDGNRTICPTAMNSTSSRAHTVTCIEFKQVEKIFDRECTKLSMINLVDLAGSEKAAQTGAQGDRLKEGAMINKSLSALGLVIEKLALKSTKKRETRKSFIATEPEIAIPYRDSKLTRLLQNALGGSSKTIMICALSPATSNFEETLSTLRYANRAKQIKNTARVNENPQEKLMKELFEENAKLKALIDSSSGGVNDEKMLHDKKELEETVERLKKAYEEQKKSWEERLKDSEKTLERMTNIERRRTVHVRLGTHAQPQLVNLNEDVQLSGKNRFEFALNHRYRIGGLTSAETETESSTSSSTNSDEDTESEHPEEEEEEEDEAEAVITLTGHGVLPKHAMITNLGHSVQLQSHGPAAALTWVNGVNFADLIENEASKSPREDEFVMSPTPSMVMSPTPSMKRALLDVPGCRSDGSESPRRFSKQQRKKMEKELPAVELHHGDRVAFGSRIFVFSHPNGLPGVDLMILSGQVDYQKARKELPGEWLHTSRAAGGRVSFARFESVDSLEDEGPGSPMSLRSSAVSPLAQEKDRLVQKVSAMEDTIKGLNQELTSSKKELQSAKDALEEKDQTIDFLREQLSLAQQGRAELEASGECFTRTPGAWSYAEMTSHTQLEDMAVSGELMTELRSIPLYDLVVPDSVPPIKVKELVSQFVKLDGEQWLPISEHDWVIIDIKARRSDGASLTLKPDLELQPGYCVRCIPAGKGIVRGYLPFGEERENKNKALTDLKVGSYLRANVVICRTDNIQKSGQMCTAGENRYTVLEGSKLIAKETSSDEENLRGIVEYTFEYRALDRLRLNFGVLHQVEGTCKLDLFEFKFPTVRSSYRRLGIKGHGVPGLDLRVKYGLSVLGVVRFDEDSPHTLWGPAPTEQVAVGDLCVTASIGEVEELSEIFCRHTQVTVELPKAKSQKQFADLHVSNDLMDELEHIPLYDIVIPGKLPPTKLKEFGSMFTLLDGSEWLPISGHDWVVFDIKPGKNRPSLKVTPDLELQPGYCVTFIPAACGIVRGYLPLSKDCIEFNEDVSDLQVGSILPADLMICRTDYIQKSASGKLCIAGDNKYKVLEGSKVIAKETSPDKENLRGILEYTLEYRTLDRLRVNLGVPHLAEGTFAFDLFQFKFPTDKSSCRRLGMRGQGVPGLDLRAKYGISVLGVIRFEREGSHVTWSPAPTEQVMVGDLCITSSGNFGRTFGDLSEIFGSHTQVTVTLHPKANVENIRPEASRSKCREDSDTAPRKTPTPVSSNMLKALSSWAGVQKEDSEAEREDEERLGNSHSTREVKELQEFITKLQAKEDEHRRKLGEQEEVARGLIKENSRLKDERAAVKMEQTRKIEELLEENARLKAKEDSQRRRVDEHDKMVKGLLEENARLRGSEDNERRCPEQCPESPVKLANGLEKLVERGATKRHVTAPETHDVCPEVLDSYWKSGARCPDTGERREVFEQGHISRMPALSSTVKTSFDDAINALDTAHFYLERSSAAVVFPKRRSFNGR